VTRPPVHYPSLNWTSPTRTLQYSSTIQIDDWNDDGADELILHTRQIFSEGPYGGLSVAFYRDREDGEWQGKQIWFMDYYPDPTVRKLNLHDVQGNSHMLVSGRFHGADRIDDVLLIWRWKSGGPELAKEIWLNNWHTWHEWEVTEEGAILVHATEATSRSAASPPTIYVLRGDVFVAERPYSLPMSVPSVRPVSPSAESISAPAHPGWTTYTNADYVSDLAFDRDGNPWAVGDGGIVRWDLADMTYTRYTMDTGLPSNRVSSVAAGTDGTLWFGMQTNGVLQFDGCSWTYHTEHCGLAENAVNAISVTRDGTLWFGLSGGGVCRLDGKTWTSFTTADGLANDYVCSIDAPLDSVLWVGGCGPLVSRFDGKVWNSYGPEDGLVNGTGASIAATADGEVWFSTYVEEGIFDTGGLSHYDGQTWITHTESSGLVHRNVKSIATTADGTVWFATGHSLSRFTGPETKASDNETWPIYTYPLDDEITSLVVAPDGALWVSTWGGGISRFDGQTWTTYMTGEGPASHNIESIAVGPDGTVWVSTHDGLSRFVSPTVGAENTGTWTTYTAIDGLPDNLIRALGIDADGAPWVGTNQGTVARFDGQTWQTYHICDGLGLGGRFVRSIAVADDGSVWVGCYGGSVSHLGSVAQTSDVETRAAVALANGLADNTVTALAVDGNGTLWVGTTDGVASFRGETWAILNQKGVTGKSITAMTAGSDGSVWLATYEGTVSHFDGRVWTTFDQKSGLRSGSVLSLDAADNGTLWAGTYSGFYRFDGERWIHFVIPTDLASDIVSAIAAVSDGSVWLGTRGSGVVRFVPPD
jgi:ligand-binding sensor domain-containing protein